ncbi:MAG: hypothetical protein IKC09_00790 [Oscillospiraceae bacterium]|nr:hypothetical protein [Oscillospiraceae bacterium]
MVANQKVTGRAWSMPAGIGLGLGLTAAATAGGCALVAWLIQGEYLGAEGLGYGALAVLLISSFLGAAGSCAVIKRRYLVVSAIHGTADFLLLLLVNGLLFGGSVSGAGVTALAVLGGSLCAALVPWGGKVRRGIRRKKRHYG